MTPDTESIRIAYLDWVRRSAALGLVLIACIAAEQVAVRADFWGAPGGGDAIRYLFWAAAVAGAFMGRGLKRRGPREEGTDTLVAARSLSWTLVGLAIMPTVVGLVLSFMTRSATDFFTMFLVSLGAYVMLFPHYKDWIEWAAHPDAQEEAD